MLYYILQTHILCCLNSVLNSVMLKSLILLILLFFNFTHSNKYLELNMYDIYTLNVHFRYFCNIQYILYHIAYITYHMTFYIFLYIIYHIDYKSLLSFVFPILCGITSFYSIFIAILQDREPLLFFHILQSIEAQRICMHWAKCPRILERNWAQTRPSGFLVHALTTVTYYAMYAIIIAQA